MGNMLEKDLSETEVPQIDSLLRDDAYLKPYESEIRRRFGCFQLYLNKINNYEGGLDQFSKSYATFGFHVDEHNNIHVLEWAPNAKSVSLRGDFSNSKPNRFFILYK